ncbi:MAG: tyrosine-type recombinase/integrase [Ktedonobacterales bacterium]
MAGKRGNGEGSIRKRADGRWEARITGSDGKPKSLYGKTRAIVAAKLSATLHAQDKGVPVQRDERLTTRAYLSDWIVRVRATLRPSTHRRYASHVQRAIGAFGSIALTKLAPQHIERLYARLMADTGLSSTTVHQLHAVLHNAFDDAMRKGLVQRNVCDLVTPPAKRRHEMTVWTPEQARMFLDTLRKEKSRYEPLFVLALHTGMRQGELLGLRWRDVDLDAGTVQVVTTLATTSAMPGAQLAERLGAPKTARSRRRIKLAPACVEALRAHRVRQAEERLAIGPRWEDHGLVFPNIYGRPMGDSLLRRKTFTPLIERAGVPRIRFHDLRHTAATLLMREGVHPRVVAEMLGHSSIAITLDVYSHVTMDMQDTATEAMQRVFGASVAGLGQYLGQDG